MIFDHTHSWYKVRRESSGVNRYNGAYYYSCEIVKNIIPRIKTDRNWITVNIPLDNRVPQYTKCGADHSIVFIHNNLCPDHYDWLSRYHDLILVCGIPETMQKVEHLGKAVYLPLSVDVEEVKSHSKPKTRGTAFVGRRSKRNGVEFPLTVDFIEGIPRDQMLDEMAKYKRVYAVGRTAIEAKVLGCEVLPYDPRFPDTDRWKVLDNRDASVILQRMINEIDA